MYYSFQGIKKWTAVDKMDKKWTVRGIFWTVKMDTIFVCFGQCPYLCDKFNF